eukprot:COSAG01_NODE_2603_length_7393_cov_39.196874_2_plen_523_part_00
MGIDFSVDISGDVFYAIQLCLFALALKSAAAFIDVIGGSGLLGFLIAGLIIGPQALDYVPETDAIRIIGRIGVSFLLLEAGLHLDKEVVKECGLRAFGLTCAGMTAPLLGAIAVMYILGYDDFLQAFSVGACFMPTSVGMSVQILSDFNELDTFSGQMIVVVAMIDDILSLVVLAVLEQLGGHDAIMSSEGATAIAGTESDSDDFDVAAAMRPLIASAVFTVFLLAFALWHQDWLERMEVKYIEWRLRNQGGDPTAGKGGDGSTINPVGPGMQETADEAQNDDDDDDEGKQDGYQLHDEVNGFEVLTREEIVDDFYHKTHILMLLEAFAFGVATCTYSTELLGVFFAGFAFSTHKGTAKKFDKESLPIMKWLGMAFFASLGFHVPLEQMLKVKMFGFGLIMTIPAVLGKLLTGMCFMPKSRIDGCKVGWGRVGRGEFAFYLADVAYHAGIMGSEAYAITVWALLNGSMGFPFAFRAVMEAGARQALEGQTEGGDTLRHVESLQAAGSSDGDETTGDDPEREE